MSSFAKLERAYMFFNNFNPHSPFHRMPDHYKRLLVRMIAENPTPVHYVPNPRDWKKDESKILSGGWSKVVDKPIPLRYPKQFHEGLWGGESIIKGYKKKGKWFTKRSPHWWFPVLRREVVYSEILDKYMTVVVTARMLNLVDENCGFDHYILKTDVIDLRSNLALKLRSKLLLALVRKELYPDDPVKREEVYEKYKQYIIPEEEAEWIGLTLKEALAKQREIDKQKLQHGPLKHEFRAQLIQQLRDLESTGSLKEMSKLQRYWAWFSKPVGRSDSEEKKELH